MAAADADDETSRASLSTPPPNPLPTTPASRALSGRLAEHKATILTPHRPTSPSTFSFCTLSSVRNDTLFQQNHGYRRFSPPPLLLLLLLLCHGFRAMTTSRDDMQARNVAYGANRHRNWIVYLWLLGAHSLLESSESAGFILGRRNFPVLLALFVFCLPDLL